MLGNKCGLALWQHQHAGHELQTLGQAGQIAERPTQPRLMERTLCAKLSAPIDAGYSSETTARAEAATSAPRRAAGACTSGPTQLTENIPDATVPDR